MCGETSRPCVLMVRPLTSVTEIELTLIFHIPGNAWSDQETKTLLSDTAQLHRKLSEMSQRIRQLEDALEISHSSNSTSSATASHPLLREELLAIKRGIDVNALNASHHKHDRDDPQTEDELEALGTLSISDQGYSRYIGTGGGEVCHPRINVLQILIVLAVRRAFSR